MFQDFSFEGSTSSAGAFPANPSPSRESEKGTRMIDGSGPSSSELSEKHNQRGALLRTSLACALSMQMKCSLTWKGKGTPAGRSWWVLSMPVRPTADSGFGLLPTPNVPNGGRSLAHVEFKGNTAYSRGKKVQVGLEGLCKLGMLPTPHSNCHTGPGHAAQGGENLQTAVANGTGPGLLSPCFVEWMMGFPAGWTELSD